VRAYSDVSETLVASTRTDSYGEYHFGSDELPGGNYRIRFGDADWYDGATSWTAATPVAVSTGSPAIIDEGVADAAGRIMGTIAGPGGVGVSVGVVQAIDPTTLAVISEANTFDDGTYYLPGLANGDYLVRASGSGLGRQYRGGSTNASGADVVHVTGSADTTGVDIVLPVESTITIDVDPDADLAPGLTAIAYDATTGEVAGTADSPFGGISGPLHIAGLDNVGYHIMLVDSSGDWASQVYGSNSLDPMSGTVVTPPEGGDAEVEVTLAGTSCADYHAGEDLSGANLAGLQLANCDLHGVNLTGAVLSGTRLSGADLTGADLTGVTVDSDTDFTNA
jgi:hypothetical protein